MTFGYPRPQMEPAQWVSLNGPWQFAFDPEQQWRTPEEVTGWPLSIEMPYPPESEMTTESRMHIRGGV